MRNFSLECCISPKSNHNWYAQRSGKTPVKVRWHWMISKNEQSTVFHMSAEEPACSAAETISQVMSVAWNSLIWVQLRDKESIQLPAPSWHKHYLHTQDYPRSKEPYPVFSHCAQLLGLWQIIALLCREAKGPGELQNRAMHFLALPGGRCQVDGARLGLSDAKQ